MGEAARLIEVDFGAEVEEAPKPAFGSAAWYAAFRAEFVRLKSMSVYERMAEKDEQTAARRRMEQRADVHDGVPVWAWYQRNIGILQTIHVWKAERFQDPDEARKGITRIRYTGGLLRRVREYQIEPAALECIDQEAMIWTSARGRTWLWSDEHRALNLEKRYLRDCGTRAFAARFGAFAQTDLAVSRGGPVRMKVKARWIAQEMGVTPERVEHLLTGVSNVYELRALLDMDDVPEVRIAAPVRATAEEAAEVIAA